MYADFIAQLKQEISKNLPGWDAQKRMAPAGREQSRYYPNAKTQPRQSSVLIWLYSNNDNIYTRLILRAEFGVHSGQVAFPGGQIEQNDGSLWNTALREAYEEVGLQSNKIEPIGALTPLYIPPSNFWVHPFIGTGEEIESGEISKAEVQKYFDVDIMQLLQPDIKGEKEVVASGVVGKIIVPVYNLSPKDGSGQTYTVWGATAMMLSELEELIRRTKAS
jgi:8-oxo-dGTP pyrophosphatase MutT (NUDIX family)